MLDNKPLEEIKPEIKELLGKDKIQEALDLLFAHLQSDDLLNQVVVQSAIFKRLNKALNQNTIDWEKSNLVKNQVIISTLSIVDAIDKKKNSDQLYGDIFSELDLLSTSIRELPQKPGVGEKLKKLVLLVLALAIIFGAGFVMGDIRFFSPSGDSVFYPNENDTTAQIEMPSIDLSSSEFESKLSSNTISTGDKYENVIGLDHIYFLESSGNQFQFVGNLGGYRAISGTAIVKGNKVDLRGADFSGTFTLLSEGRKLVGNLAFDQLSIPRNLDLELVSE